MPVVAGALTGGWLLLATAADFPIPGREPAEASTYLLSTDAPPDAPTDGDLPAVDGVVRLLEDAALSEPVAPERAPQPSAPPRAEIDRIRLHLEAGDTENALAEARALTATASGATADSAWFTVGFLRREEGGVTATAEARDAFHRVRVRGGPLADLAWWHEAEQALFLDDPDDAIRLCESYRAARPEGANVVDCLRVIALGHASRGRAVPAVAASAAYDEEHPYAGIGESVDLQLALWDANHDAAKAIPRLQRLAVHHRTPLAGRVAEEELAILRADGHADAVVPDDTASLQARALSLRDTKRTDLAWEAYQRVVDRGATDPAAAAWAAAQADSFGWRTRSWDFLIARYQARLDAEPEPGIAWTLFHAAHRGGRADVVVRTGRHMLTTWPDAPEWRWHADAIGRAMLLAGDPVTAVKVFDALAEKGGRSGKRAKTMAGFSAFRAGNDAGALARLRSGADDGDRTARYWYARALERSGKDATERLTALATDDPWDWYGILATSRLSAAVEPRDGRWPAAPALPGEFAPIDSTSDALAFALPSGEDLLHEPPTVLRRDPAHPPRSYPTGRLFERDAARARMRDTATRFGATWPELAAAAELADLGLYDLSGPMMSAVYLDRATALAKRTPKRAAAKQWAPAPDEWRSLFLFTRDHHHTARTTWGLWSTAALGPRPASKAAALADPDHADALRIAYPLAHDRYVWTSARDEGVDPLLVLGLMRQESTYNAIARSRVGARGAMQIMPRTGHLLADQIHDVRFTAGDLEDPTLAVGYGIRYIGLLMDRFDGAFPLAVASYNAGPFNASAWLRQVGPGAPMDEWVEQIPLRETRDYVKRVTGGYAAYLALYGPEGAAVSLAATPVTNDPDIVDF